MSQSAERTNRLAHETSPYLRQHARNPVDWYPWGAEALARAKELDRPIFLSIGYSACHWCHVMEHESFENEEIARALNDNFVPVTVEYRHPDGIGHAIMRNVGMRLRGTKSRGRNEIQGFKLDFGALLPPVVEGGHPTVDGIRHSPECPSRDPLLG